MVAAIDDRDREEDIDLRAVADTLWSKRRWIALSALLFAVPFAIAAVVMKPVYRAVTVLVDARADNGGMSSIGAALSQLGNIASLARINIPGGGTHVDEALAVFKSREFTEGFIKDQNLLPQLFPDRWDAAAQRWKGDEKEWPTLAQGFSKLDGIRGVAQPVRGGLITVSIDWTDPAKAAEWVNASVARLNSEMRARAIADTNSSVSYLEKELAATSTIDTRQAINRLMEAQINQRMVANVTEEFAFRIVDRALPPQEDDSISPSKLLLVALGPTMGVIFGILAVLAVNVINARRAGAKASR